MQGAGTIYSSKKDTPKIEVTMEMDSQSDYVPEDTATYRKIKDYVKEKRGLNVSGLYIVQAKDKCGIDILRLRASSVYVQFKSVIVRKGRFCGDCPIELTSTEYEMLKLLVENRRQVFGGQRLYEAVWNEPYYYGANNTVMAHIRNLRQKIERDPKNPVIIKTSWGKGYHCD